MDESKIMELIEAMAAAKQEHKAFNRRLDDHDAALKKLSDMTVAITKQGNAIESMGKSLEGIGTKIDKVALRVDAIEKEPADKAKKIAFEVLKYVVLAVVGAAVGYFIKG